MRALAAAKEGRQHPVRVHRPDGTSASESSGIPAIAATTEEAIAIWLDLLDAFHDRRAADRLVRDTNARVENRWRPKLGLVLPPEFSIDRPGHRDDLTVALELLAATVEQYNLVVISDSPDAPRFFSGVRSYSTGAIAECNGVLVLGSRSLNDLAAGIRPSRLVMSDPCAFRTEARRIVFEAGRVDLPFERADDSEVIDACRLGVSAFIDENDDSPGFLDALKRVAPAEASLRVTLSSRSDEAFADRVRAALAELPRVEVVEAPEPSPDGPEGFVLSNEPIALLTRPDPSRPGFLFRKDRFLWVDPEGLSRPELYLHRGEEANPAELLGRWLDPTADEPSTRSRSVGRAEAVEPMVSIVIPVYDRTTELVRLASSLFRQSHPWVEVLFVSNGSPPATLEALRVAEGHLMKRRYRVRIIELPEPCGSATIPRDVGIRAATGDVICVLDSDDWLEPDFFSFLTANGGQWRDDTIYYPKKVFRNFGRPMRDDFPWDSPLDGPGTIEPHSFPGTLRKLGNFMCNSGVCFSRSLFHKAGGIDHRLHYGEDLYLWWRIALVGGRAQGHDGMVNIALHPGNNELAVGEDRRLEEAVALACDRGQRQWL